jgi:hypothetical protein
MNSGWLDLWHPVSNVGNEKKENIPSEICVIPLPPPPPEEAAGGGEQELNVEGKRKPEEILNLPEEKTTKRGRKKKQK